MPNSLQTLDTSFPKIDSQQTTEENFVQVTNYLYMLLENLKYTLGNLGEENFNDTAMEDMVKMIREPIWARIEDAEGNINNLNITAKSLSSQISDINGNVSSLTQTSQTLISRIGTAEGNISTLTQTASSLTSKISDAEGNISSLSQTVNGMTLSVSNSGTSSTIKLMRNGVAVSSQSITLSGYVTFTDLSSPGSTTISGSNITTGTISSSRIRLFSSMAVYTGSSGSTIGGYIGYTTSANDGSAGVHMQKGLGEVVATSNGAKITYNGSTSQVNVHSDGATVISNGVPYYFGSDAFFTNANSDLGNKNNPWGEIWGANSSVSVSDRNKKNTIEDLDGRYVILFDNLRIRRFKFNNGTSDRFHPGFVSQEVEEALELSGIDSKEFAGFVKDVDPDTGEDLYFLRYEEFIAILALKIKQQEKRIQALEEAT